MDFSKLTDEENKTFSDFCGKLLEKKIPPPNRYIAKLLERWENTKVNLGVTRNNLQQLQQQVEQLNGQVTAYADDIDNWIEWHLFGEKEDAKEGPALEAIKGGKGQPDEDEPLLAKKEDLPGEEDTTAH